MHNVGTNVRSRSSTRPAPLLKSGTAVVCSFIVFHSRCILTTRPSRAGMVWLPLTEANPRGDRYTPGQAASESRDIEPCKRQTRSRFDTNGRLEYFDKLDKIRREHVLGKEVPTAYGSDAPQAWPTSMLFRRHTCTKFPVWRFPAPSNRRAMIQLGLGTGLGLSRQLKVTINQAIFTRSSSERWKKHIATAGSRRNSSHFQVHTAASSPAACPPPSDRTIRFTPATPHDYVTKSRTCTRFELLASLSARDTASTKLFGTRLFLNSLPRTPASPISDSKPRSQPDEENLACCGAMDDRDHLALTIFSSFSSSGSDLFPLVATERYDETSIACHSNRRCGAKACKDGLRSCYPRSVEKGSPNLQRLSLVALPRHGMLCQRCMHTCTTVEQTL
ncbi:predicted protein [Plenodomus lingam JN3]|uniref:Predicted protein n=1 Tax=Leptosphaeria maculans (strain JN3 / isolate v23.1.3 / race Av1-4-5-6-7-8) TaxID=985895 RepID=E4ZUR2_LEPMJ|nr:predicted protein [Plenodomus lingam JN3]CBX95141.1 predicted protein [Plenodomus lingam JN3]